MATLDIWDTVDTCYNSTSGQTRNKEQKQRTKTKNKNKEQKQRTKTKNKEQRTRNKKQY